MRILFVLAIALTTSVYLSGCAGADGSDGSVGPQGARGATGEQGAEGPAGADGAPGEDAHSYRPVAWVACLKTLDLLAIGTSGAIRQADGAEETQLDYSFTLYSNDDVDTRCGSAIGSAQADSGDRYYPSWAQGSATGGCTTRVNYPDTGNAVGAWYFEVIDGEGPRASYSDPDASNLWDGASYKYTDADCTVLLAPDGEWVEMQLADVF